MKVLDSSHGSLKAMAKEVLVLDLSLGKGSSNFGLKP